MSARTGIALDRVDLLSPVHYDTYLFDWLFSL
jgi:hypothetical protein